MMTAARFLPTRYERSRLARCCHIHGLSHVAFCHSVNFRYLMRRIEAETLAIPT